MIEVIQVPLETIRLVADMRRAQKTGNVHQAHILEGQVDQVLVDITNSLDRLKTGRFYDDIHMEVESRR